MGTGIITEIVDFKVNPNTTEEQVVEIVDLVEKEFHFKQDGFIDTELVRGKENNHWVMIHHYESLETLQAAIKNMSNSSLLDDFSTIVDKKSVEISLLEQVQSWAKR